MDLKNAPAFTGTRRHASLSMADGAVPGTLSRHNEPGRADDDLCGRGVEKFSPFWSDAQFDQMEQRVVSYHSPDMLENARDRFSLKAYWPYWGSLQEALLPAMDPARSKSKALQAVLQRRKEQGFGDVWYKKEDS